MTTTKINLNKISFFKPVEGKTLREQLRGKILAGADVVKYLRSLGDTKNFTPPSHWEKPFGDANRGGKWIYGFSLTHLAPRPGLSKSQAQVNGFVWAEDGISSHWRHFHGDVLDMMVGRQGWCQQDWILVVTG